MSRNEVGMVNYLIINGVRFPLPECGPVLLQMSKSEIASAEILRADQHVATLQGFLEIAEFAGYRVIPPEND